MMEYGFILMVVAIAVIIFLTTIGKTTSSQICGVTGGFDNTSVCGNLLGADAASLENSTGGWLANGTNTATQTTAAAKDGTHSLALTANAAGQLSAYNPGITLAAGQTYIVKGYFQAATVGRGAFVQIDWNNAHGSIFSPTVTDGTGTWTVAEMAVAVPTDQGAQTSTIEARVNSAAGSGEVHYVDHISITPSTTTNLLTSEDASFEGGTVGSWSNGANAALSNTTAQAAVGQNSLQMTAVAAGNAQATTGYIPVVPSTQYIVFASERAATVARSGLMLVNFFDAAGSYITTSTGTGAALSTTAWTGLPTLAITPPANCHFIQVLVRAASAGAGEVFYIDQVAVNPGFNTTWSAGYSP